MVRLNGVSIILLTAMASASTTSLAGAALVDMSLAPPDQTACVGEVIGVDILVASDGAPQPFQAVDSVIAWDPAILELVGNDDSNAGASWFLSGFLPDPDGINDDLTDGEVIFTVLVSPGQSVNAPAAPGTLIVTTLLFEVVSAAGPAEVAYVPTSGTFGQSRVLLSGMNITGIIGGPAQVTGITPSCPADFNCDTNVDALDFLLLIAQWGTPCVGDCVADISGPTPFVPDGNVDAIDFLVVIAQWGNPGNCPP